MCNFIRDYIFFTAMLIYRTQRNLRKRRLKLIHAGQMFLIVLLTVIALVAVFDSHNLASPPVSNMYTLHSWIGLTTVILFCCQVNLFELHNNFKNLDVCMLICCIYSGLLDVSPFSILDYMYRYELLICQFTCISALRALLVQLLHVYWDSMKRHFLF